MKSKILKYAQRFISLFCASVIAVFSIFYQISIPVFAASSDWSSLGDDAVALRDAYLRYFNGWCSGSASDIIGGAIDVPVSWFKTLSDGTKVISPVDDWYFYLTDGDDLGGSGGRVHSGGGGSHSEGVHLASEVAPVLPAESLKEAASYWAEYYKPMPTTTQYLWSYQSRESTNTSPYAIGSMAPIYMNANGSWGRKDWDSVYVIFFYKDDDLGYTCFSKNYYHFYSHKDKDYTYIDYDQYDLATGACTYPYCVVWSASSYPFLALNTTTNTEKNTAHLNRFTSYADYLSFTNYSTLSSNFDFGYLIASDYSLSDGFIYTMRKSLTFTPDTNKNDDWGFILSSEPFVLFKNQTTVDFDHIPDNYTITINGDNFYDYSITNPDTGDTETIYYYITNNYTLPDNGNKEDNSGSSSGTSSGDVNVGGNVTVSGDVNVGGEITIKTDPIDINVNVNGGGSSGSGSSEAAGVQFDEDVSLNNYYDWMNEQTSGFSGFMSQFFSWLPADIVVLLCAGFACVILARFLGR